MQVNQAQTSQPAPAAAAATSSSEPVTGKISCWLASEPNSASEVPVLSCRGSYAEIGTQAKEKGEQGETQQLQMLMSRWCAKKVICCRLSGGQMIL